MWSSAEGEPGMDGNRSLTYPVTQRDAADRRGGRSTFGPPSVTCLLGVTVGCLPKCCPCTTPPRDAYIMPGLGPHFWPRQPRRRRLRPIVLTPPPAGLEASRGT